MKIPILLMLLCISCFSWDIYGKQYNITVPIKDKISKRDISGGFDVCNVIDSAVIGSSKIFNLGRGASGNFDISDKKVILRVYGTEELINDGRFMGLKESEKYGIEWIMLELPENDTEILVTPVMLGRPKRKTTTLEEVTVTSSKVMFYHKGDTLIYNADSFILAEGSTPVFVTFCE